MSFFSNFFKKKENDQPVATVSFSEKVGSVFADPDIPTLQGDYAKAVFLGHIVKLLPSRITTVMPDIFCMNVVSEIPRSIIGS